MISSIILEKGKEKEAILKLLIFFDLFDYPLSLMELASYLRQLAGGTVFSLSEVLFWLEELSFSEKIVFSDGFYFLPGREEIIASRRNRYNYSQRKLKIARRFAAIFALSPFVRKIAVANSIGSYNLRDGSDIDFFIVSAKKRIFLSRFFCTGLAKLLNSRPNSKVKRDKICLSFYLSEDGPNLEDLKLPGGDPYFDFWEAGLLFLCNKEKTKSFPPFFDFIESLARFFQLFIMPRGLRCAAAPLAAPLGDFGVVIGRDILKMYLSDKRFEIKKRYETKLAEIL